MGRIDLNLDGSVNVERLFELARQKSKAGREALYQDLWTLFEQRDLAMSGSERQLMLDVLRHLSRDIEMSVRVKLAERLAASSGAPRDLVVMLANDRIEVAYPVLIESRALKSIDLVEVVRHRLHQHRLAVAMRRNLDEDVSRALVESGDAGAIKALIENTSAKIEAALLERLVEDSRGNEAFQRPLLGRPDLPKPLAERMYFWVSAALRSYIAENFDVDIDDVDDDVAAAAEEALASAEEEIDQPDPAQKLVDKLHEAGELTAAFLVKSLRQGQVKLFELGMAKLIDIRAALMRRLVYEPGGEALAIACRAVGIDRAVFMTIFHLTRHARNDLGLAGQEAIELKAFYDRISPDDARRVLRKWQRNPKYLAALKQIGVER